MWLILLFWVLQVCLATGVAGKPTLAECNGAGYIDIVSNKTTPVTCTGLDPGRTVFWGITAKNESTTQVLGQCSPCEQAPCANCTVGNAGYPITRQPTKTTIDLTISGTHDTFSLVCDIVEEPPRSANCTVHVKMQPYNFPDCINNSLNIFVDGKTRIRCTGLAESQDIFWSISFDNGTELKLADCNKCTDSNSANSTCYNCQVPNGDYKVTRKKTVSVLRLVKGDDRNKDGARIACSDRDNTSSANCTLRIQRQPYNFPDCINNSLNIFVDGKTRIRCTGLAESQDIFWSISFDNGTELKLADCNNCTYSTSANSTCYNCQVPNDDYKVTRNKTFSVLRLVKGDDKQKDGARIACSDRDNTSSANCTLRIQMQPYNLPDCINNSLNVFVKGKTRIRCTGLAESQAIFWSISFDNGTELKLADCNNCTDSNSANRTCYNCQVPNGDYKVTRNKTFSVLRLVKGDDRHKDGARIACSDRDNTSTANCTLRIHTYTLPQCEDGRLNVSDVSPWTAIRCADVDRSHRVNWTITYAKDSVSTIATCEKKSNNYTCTLYSSEEFNETMDEFIVTRNDTFSELMIKRKRKAKDNGTLITCMRRDGAAAVNCSLRVIPHQYNLPQCVNNEVSVSGIAPWTTIRCEDLKQGHVINWTLTDPHGNTSTVATCDRKANGFNCTTYNDDYTVSRINASVSELMIVKEVREKAGSNVTCMKDNGKFAVSCNLHVIPFTLPQCQHGRLNVSEVPPWTPIRCEDLDPGQGVHWTITSKGTVSTIATCEDFNCTMVEQAFNVTRNNSTSELMITGGVKSKDNETLTCMRTDGAAAVDCRLRVVPHQYNLPQCQNGQLYVSDFVPWTPIRCENLIRSHVINWTVTDPHGNTSTVATCDKGSGWSNCTTYDKDYNVSRINESVSELMIVKEVGQKAGSNVTCMSDNGNVTVSCRLHVFPEANGNQDMQLFATVGGVLGALLLIIVVVVVIVVITQRQKEGPRRPRKNVPENVDASFDDSNTEGYSRICDIDGDNAHNFMSVDNPCFIGTTASSVPMQLSTVSTSALARNGNETQDLDEHTYTEVDLEDDVWKKGSGGPAENTGRVVILKQDPSAKTKRGTLTGPDGYSDIDIQPDTQHVGSQGPIKVTFKEENLQGFPSTSNSPLKSKMHTASNGEDYSHLVINAAKKEGPNASKNVTSSNPDASEYSLAKVLPASTGKETPDDADAYNRIAITSNTADKQLQDTKNVHIENQDTCSTLPAIATISNGDTERAAGEDPYDHIQADDYSHIVITSAKEEGAQASKNVASSNPNTSEYSLAKVLPASTRKETPADADAYNRITITSNTADKQLQDTKNSDIKNQDTGSTSAKEERPNASKNFASSNPDASEYSLAKVMPASTGKETPVDAAGYNRVAIDSDAADKQPQDVNIKDSDVENQDARGTLPATATPSQRETESVAEEDQYNHINTVTD